MTSLSEFWDAFDTAMEPISDYLSEGHDRALWEDDEDWDDTGS